MIRKTNIGNWKEEAALETTSPERLDYFAKNGDYSVRLAVARNSNTAPETLDWLSKDESMFIQRSVAINPHTPDNTLRQFVSKKIFLKEVAENQNASEITLREILSLQPDPAAKGIKKIFQMRITKEELTKVFKIALKHTNLPEQFVDEFLRESELAVHEKHEVKASRKELPLSLRVRDFLPYIYDNYIALLAYTENAQKAIVLALFSSEQTENKTYLEKSIISYRKERAAGYLSSENFSADDLLDATVARVGTFPSCIAGSKSTIALTIREIYEEKKLTIICPEYRKDVTTVTFHG